jgi:hypothetical protein
MLFIVTADKFAVTKLPQSDPSLWRRLIYLDVVHVSDTKFIPRNFDQLFQNAAAIANVWNLSDVSSRFLPCTGFKREPGSNSKCGATSHWKIHHRETAPNLLAGDEATTVTTLNVYFTRGKRHPSPNIAHLFPKFSSCVVRTWREKFGAGANSRRHIFCLQHVSNVRNMNFDVIQL